MYPLTCGLATQFKLLDTSKLYIWLPFTINLTDKP